MRARNSLLAYITMLCSAISGPAVAQMFTSGYPPGVTTGIPQGVTSGIPQGVTSGIPQGVTTAIPRGVTSGIPRGVTTGIPRGVTTGIPRGVTTGIPRGVTTGIPRGVTTGVPQGVTTGIPSGVGTGIPRGVTTGIPSAVSRGQDGVHSGTGFGAVPPSNSNKVITILKVKPSPLPQNSSGSIGPEPATAEVLPSKAERQRQLKRQAREADARAAAAEADAAEKKAAGIKAVAGAIPGVGTVVGINDATLAARKGDYKGAAVELVGAVPYSRLLKLGKLAHGRAAVQYTSTRRQLRPTTHMVSGVTVRDHKTGTIMNGTVDLRPTLAAINSGGSRGKIFNNVRGDLPRAPPGYYTEHDVPTSWVSDRGPQRIVKGAKGELYYTPDHYESFVPLN